MILLGTVVGFLCFSCVCMAATEIALSGLVGALFDTILDRLG